MKVVLKVVYIASISIIIVLAGCATAPRFDERVDGGSSLRQYCQQLQNPQQANQTAIGAVIGGVLGGIAGAQSGREIEGVLAGGAVGGVIGEQIKRQMRESSVRLQSVASDALTFAGDSNVFFDSGRIDVKPNAVSTLRNIAKILNDCSILSLEIVGHTDADGSDEYNLALSRKRAQSVRVVLVALEVTPEQITISGRGEREPIATNQTQEGKEKNRRVEFVFR